MDEAAFAVRLVDYLQREQGLKSAAEPWSRTLNIADLPADLKHEMLVRTQQGLLNQALGGVSMLRNFLSEETWSHARIALSPTGNILSLILPTEHSTITHQLMPASQISQAPQ